ncbi:neuronal acetylcholine receptor subunit alpha-7-like [Patella vulgata]|uniref:neuronal acetylcholine receptor subunit alpha-7-like n=1 Tax=Patella vulgata TaxID=6465 RepID=UPI00217FD646|nr:neuronal acetylcholine receptor subunit alpha-7-like [Patella vulgata]
MDILEFQVIYWIVGMLISRVDSITKEDRYNLYTELFVDSFYNPNLRPVESDADPLEVWVTFSLISISEVREKDQTLVGFGYIGLKWADTFLGWNSTRYNGLEDMVVPQVQVWRPDVVIGNMVEKTTMLGFDEMPIRLINTGHIMWFPNILFQTACDINLRYYPFDTQVCTIQLNPLVSVIGEIELRLAFGHNPLAEYGPNGQWELIKLFLEETNDQYKSILKFGLTLKRRRSFYIMNVVLPIIFLSFMGILVFALPAESGEKMSLTITILLAYIVYLTIISENMPQTSIHISLLAVYLTILVALSAISVIITTLVLRLHHTDDSIPVSRGIGKVTNFFRGRRRRSSKIVNTQNAVVTPSSTESIDGSQDSDDNVTWKDVARSLDVIFFWLYLLITGLSTVVLLLLMLT